MKCSKIKRLLPQYVNNELSRAQTDDFNRHLADCPDCRTVLEDYRFLLDKSRIPDKTPAIPDLTTDTIERIKTMSNVDTTEGIKTPARRWLRTAFAAVPIVVILITLLVIHPWQNPFTPQKVLAKADEAISELSSYRMTLAYTAVSGDQSLEHAFDVDYVEPSLYHATVTFNGVSTEFIRTGGELYRYDISGTGSVYYSFPSIPSKEDTSEMLRWLTDVEELPDVEVDGVDCRHYRGKFDIERMISELYGSKAGQAEARMLESMRDVVMNIELWIGKDDYLLRKSLQETSNPIPGFSGEPVAWNTSVAEARYYDFNTDILIEPPMTASGELLPGWEIVDQSPAPVPQATPGITQEFEPTRHFQIQADESQLELIENFWGEDIGIIKFLEAICPEVVQELPEPLLRNRSNVPWPGQTLNWGIPVTNAVSSSTSISITEYADESSDEILEIRTYDFYFYVGKESQEHLPDRQVSLQPGEIYEYYAISIYTGN